MKKKGITFAVLLSLLAFAISSCEDNETKYFTIGDYTFRAMSVDEVELTHVNSSIKSACLSPTISYQGVTYHLTMIGDGAFEYCDSLTSLTIPFSVTSIGDMAFGRCKASLTSIVVESGNSTYDSRDNCNAIIETETNTLIAGCPNTTIPNSVTSIGDRAFYFCSSLTSITIPNSITSIGNYAFNGCSSLTSMVVESGNSTYDSRDNCNAIIETATNTLIAGCSNTTIPNSVTSIGDNAFYCSSLTSITIGNSVTSIGEAAFFGCTSLTSITIGNSVTSIGDHTFYCCYSLTKVTIPNSVTSIGSEAFRSCSSLTSLTIGNGVTSIGDGAFYNCILLKAVDYAGTKAQWKKIKNQKDCILGSHIQVIRCTDGEIVI